MARNRLIHKLLRMGVLGGGEPYPITGFAVDNFTTADDAPITTPRTWDGGTGSWTVVQTDGQFSIADGQLVIPTQATPTVGDLGMYSDAITRAAGMCLAFSLNVASTPAENMSIYLHSAAAVTASPELGLYWESSAVTARMAGVSLNATPITEDLSHIYHIVLRTAGAFHIYDGKLIHVSNTGNTATLYAGLMVYTGNGSINYIKRGQLGGPWVDTYGPGALVVSGAVSAGQTFTHMGNFTAYFTVTSNGSAGGTVWEFRKQDATNYWKLTISNDGSADLSEVVANSATSRGTAAAGAFADADRVGIYANGTTIRINDQTGTKISYTSATNFATATAGQLTSLGTDAVMSNLEVYPMDLFGVADAWLDALVSKN